MPENTSDEIHAYIAELRDRARKSQAESHDVLDPLYLERDRKPPPATSSRARSFTCAPATPTTAAAPFHARYSGSRRTCGSRRSPISARRRSELVAGGTYRFTAVVRNRGDLMVPSAKVEFWLVNPTLGFEPASRQDRRRRRPHQAYAATEVASTTRCRRPSAATAACSPGCSPSRRSTSRSTTSPSTR